MPRSIEKVIACYAQRARLEHMKPHDFRHFVGTQLVEREGIRKALWALGHKSIETTARHYDLSDRLEPSWTDHLY